MGLKLFSDPDPLDPGTCSPTPILSGSKPKLGEPQPRKFKIHTYKQLSNAVAMMIEYPGCMNYGGMKILVYDNYEKLNKLINRKMLDPHFLENSYSPIARFEPTDRGWELACNLLKELENKWLMQSKVQ